MCLFMAFIIVIPAWVYAVFMPVHTNCPLHQLIVYSLQSLWVPQFLLRTHNPHVLVLQVIYALTCRTLQVLIALLLHPQSYVSCSYMGMGRSMMGFISGGPFWNGAIYVSTAQQ